jgi:hypothetical protein
MKKFNILSIVLVCFVIFVSGCVSEGTSDSVSGDSISAQSTEADIEIYNMTYTYKSWDDEHRSDGSDYRILTHKFKCDFDGGRIMKILVDDKEIYRTYEFSSEFCYERTTPDVINAVLEHTVDVCWWTVGETEDNAKCIEETLLAYDSKIYNEECSAFHIVEDEDFLTDDCRGSLLCTLDIVSGTIHGGENAIYLSPGVPNDGICKREIIIEDGEIPTVKYE